MPRLNPARPTHLLTIAPIGLVLLATAACSDSGKTEERPAPVAPSSAVQPADTAAASDPGVVSSPNSSGSSTAGGSASAEPITDGQTTIGDIQGGIIPVYDTQIVHDGSRLTWKDDERLTIGWKFTSPTVKRLDECGTEVSLESDDHQYKKSDWTTTMCDVPNHYYFEPDRIGGYTLDFTVTTKQKLQLHQKIHFTLAD